jgi:hypothetical protein
MIYEMKLERGSRGDWIVDLVIFAIVAFRF